MVKIEASVDINRPIEDVFAYVTDPNKTPEWSSGALECTLEGSGPIGVGSCIRETGKFLGRRLESRAEVTVYDPPRRFAMRASGPGHFEIERHLESVGEGTRYRSRIVGDPGGVFKLADPILATLMKRAVETDHQTLKALLEAKVPSGA
jgi:carbon monoxide dehydrogenase subunit G